MQMYDKETARSDKREQHKTLAILRQMKHANNYIDQYSLVPCGIQAVRYTKEHPEIGLIQRLQLICILNTAFLWTNGARRLNH